MAQHTNPENKKDPSHKVAAANMSTFSQTEASWFDPNFDVESFVKNRLESWREFDDKHFATTDDFVTVVVKGHLILEQYLTRLISEYCKFNNYLEDARLTFRQKIYLARALIYLPPQMLAGLWQVFELLNKIRNDVAHNLDSHKLKAHLLQLRAHPACKAKDKHERKILETDTGLLKCMFGYCSGYLQPVSVIVAGMEKSKRDAWSERLKKEAKANEKQNQRRK